MPGLPAAPLAGTAPHRPLESPTMNEQRTPRLSPLGPSLLGLSTRWALTALAAATVLVFAAGCSSVPERNLTLEQAQSDHRAAQNDTLARDLAPVQMKQATDALRAAEAAFQRKDRMAEVDHLSNLASTRAAIARETGARTGAERSVAEATTEREQVRLQARTAEADAAQRSATTAQQQAASAQRSAEGAQRDAAASQQMTAEAQARNRALEAQMREMNAQSTERGLVITLGDVLFDTGRAQLRSGGQRSVEKLVAFMQEYPERKAMVEGFTDSVGSEAMNQGLSERRAEAVRSALVGQGVASARVSSRGYGEAYPVAGNDDAGGRAQNRRVEIVLSDDSGRIAPR